MRCVQRVAIESTAQSYLNQQQAKVNGLLDHGKLEGIEQKWKTARKSKNMGKILGTLQSMMGDRQRCMYCLDSHGCDIEHFRPKIQFPKRMFRWRNLLLCCTECGRFKGNRFPMDGRRPMLIDPTKEEPWDHLDFDPITGNITAKFDLQANDFSPKGLHTVSTLQLDRREALAAGYMQTYRKLCIVINRFLQTPIQTDDDLIAELLQEDGHGLLGWCFKGTSQNESVIHQLKIQYPATWQSCCAAFKCR